MKELLRSIDPVALSWVSAVLADAGIECEIFDTHASILEGSMMMLPRRLMVDDTDFQAASEILEDLRRAGHPL